MYLIERYDFIEIVKIANDILDLVFRPQHMFPRVHARSAVVNAVVFFHPSVAHCNQTSRSVKHSSRHCINSVVLTRGSLVTASIQSC